MIEGNLVLQGVVDDSSFCTTLKQLSAEALGMQEKDASVRQASPLHCNAKAGAAFVNHDPLEFSHLLVRTVERHEN